MWNNVDDWWTICGSKNRSTRPLWTMWTIFRKKKCYEKNFLREKRIRNIVHKSTEPHCPFPGRGTALRNISDPRRLPFYGITEAICQGCAGTALAALPLTDGSGCANCAKRRRGMKDPSSLETGSRSVIEFGVCRESRYLPPCCPIPVTRRSGSTSRTRLPQTEIPKVRLTY